MSKYVIGSANFGKSYGLSKKKVKKKEIFKILKFAKKLNIKFIDTASFYGNSEKILGELKNQNFNYITKIKLNKKCLKEPSYFRSKIIASINKLNIKKLYAVMIHNPLFLKEDKKKQIFNDLLEIKKKGLLKKIGASVYKEKEIEFLLKNFEIDIIQIPINIFDRRFITSGVLKKLKKKGIEIHARSIFLQGLLLKTKYLSKFTKWNYIFKRYKDWLNKKNISGLTACVKYALSQKNIDKIVIGIDSKNHLKMISEIKNRKKLTFPKFIFSNKKKLINPRYWQNEK